MSTAAQEIDERFGVDEMVTATDLQSTAVGKLAEKIHRMHKLLVMHYNKPVGVLLEVEVFTALIRRVRELEAQAEEMAAQKLIDERIAKVVASRHWDSQEHFTDAATRILGENAKAGE